LIFSDLFAKKNNFVKNTKMKIAIVYATKYGTTKKVAEKIQSEIGIEKVQLFNLKEFDKIDLSQFDSIFIGGSIYAGRIQKKVSEFCRKNSVSLLRKRLGLFICCMYEGEIAEQQIKTAYPEILLNYATSIKVLGGDIMFDKMNFFEKVIIKKVSGVKESISNINYTKITEMIIEMNK